MNDLLTTGEAAKILGVHPGTLINWRSWKIGPKFFRKGRLIFYHRDVIEAHLLKVRHGGSVE